MLRTAASRLLANVATAAPKTAVNVVCVSNVDQIVRV